MGLLDFLKKKAEPQSEIRETVSSDYLGDLEKTGILFQLVETLLAERDENWQNTFLDTIAEASFRCGEPQVITGPDGFNYFQLFLPEPNQGFQCFVIDKMKDDFLLQSGLGIVINPTATQADWVLSYGDILNYHLNKTFYTSEETPFSKETGDEVLQKDEEVMIGQPSEVLLPKTTRKLLSDLLKLNGIKTPKVFLLMRRIDGGSGVTQDLVFNVTPKNFKDEQTFGNIMRTLSWYLPKHYSFIGMDEQAGDGFENL